ncbi:hypothetical protein H2200_004496 [Cladophialophora chaetospira]|uniref:FAD-binding domain-containing protein n=1 Tax=Cladophialophora chaetospira TaxID=386627 RepID=A0AA39CJJ0_9EURO|nr:hypothetical protein H2200_004496 [Cladophialophora chaetospira]
MSKLHDVIIAGAGPVGLLLACELGLAGVSVLVLERETRPDSDWKVFPLGMRGLNTLSVETIYRRGLLDKLFETGERPTSFPKTTLLGGRFAGHFAGIMLDSDKVDFNRWKHRLIGPALMPGRTTLAKFEAVMAERAENLGVTILRGCPVSKVSEQDGSSVTVEAGEEQIFRCRWLVGCDGGRSVVRKATGIDFVGTEPKYTAYSIKCNFEPAQGLAPGFHATDGGMYAFMGSGALHLMDFDDAAFDRTQEITREHLQDVFNRVTGNRDVKITAVHLASSSTDRCKQATSYRKGRILLAGDAAHIHSPLGAQGLNLGLGDAMNLGWKLAATVRREVNLNDAKLDLSLLDTYERERHPIGEWVLEWTRAQITTLQPNPYGKAIRKLVQDLIDTTDGTNLLVDRVWGLSQRYELGEAADYSHPLIGSSAPDFDFDDGSRLGPKLANGKGLLVDFEDNPQLKKLVTDGNYSSQVDYLAPEAKNTSGLGAVLVRPDGIVAWLAEEKAEADLEAAETALEKWFPF